MSDYQPKADDKVMVGEHGPFLIYTVGQKGAYVEAEGTSWYVPQSWLTPAPEPEPDLPTTPGALVRDGKDDLLVVDAERDWMYLTGEYRGSYDSPPDITRPITVVLNDPAEVETLRTERDEAANELAHLSSLVKALTDPKNDCLRQRDELRRYVERVVTDVYGFEQRSEIAATLRDEL